VRFIVLELVGFVNPFQCWHTHTPLHRGARRHSHTQTSVQNMIFTNDFRWFLLIIVFLFLNANAFSFHLRLLGLQKYTHKYIYIYSPSLSHGATSTTFVLLYIYTFAALARISLFSRLADTFLSDLCGISLARNSKLSIRVARARLMRFYCSYSLRKHTVSRRLLSLDASSVQKMFSHFGFN